MMTRSTASFAVTVGLLFNVAAASAQSQPARETRATILSPFTRGVRELQVGSGLFISENYFDPLRPQMNDVDVTTRLGWMLTDPVLEGIFRGNFEFVTEIFGGGFVKGPADGLAGVTLFLRYNYVQPGARFVPYVHAGGGGVYSDASEAQPQRELGSPLLFNLQAGFGARFFCTKKCALFLELNYRHLSNGGLGERNVGLNSAGSWLGASFFF
jgi:hypothetical protein